MLLQLPKLSTRSSLFTSYCCDPGGNSGLAKYLAKRLSVVFSTRLINPLPTFSQTSLATQRFCYLASRPGRAGKLLGAGFISVNIFHLFNMGKVTACFHHFSVSSILGLVLFFISPVLI